MIRKTTHAIKKRRESVKALTEWIEIWKCQKWPDLQYINLRIKSCNSWSKNTSIQSAAKLPSDIVRTFAVFKLCHKHKFNDKYCNGKRLHNCRDIIHLWEQIRTWMCFTSCKITQFSLDTKQYSSLLSRDMWYWK